jgi:hypothetical protein
MRDRGQLRRFQEVSTDGEHWAAASTLVEVFAPPADSNSGHSPVSTEIDLDDTRGNWFYLNSRGQQCGPATTEEMTRLLRELQISPLTLVWTDAMVAWQPLVATRLRDDAALGEMSSFHDSWVSRPLGDFFRRCRDLFRAHWAIGCALVVGLMMIAVAATRWLLR